MELLFTEVLILNKQFKSMPREELNSWFSWADPYLSDEEPVTSAEMLFPRDFRFHDQRHGVIIFITSHFK